MSEEEIIETFEMIQKAISHGHIKVNNGYVSVTLQNYQNEISGNYHNEICINITPFKTTEVIHE